MSDEIRLGYQAGVVSLQSPTYGRLWLSVEHQAGDTVSCTQAEALVRSAATLIQNSGGMLLKFSHASAFAGKQLFFLAPNRSLWRNCFLPLFTFLSLIAQKLR
ncbi:MAG TPA: hypothetical protein VMN99_05045 [Anaerolineales bacterium]|nr:hypothetical protein [Anaerolineales bacterium]